MTWKSKKWRQSGPDASRLHRDRINRAADHFYTIAYRILIEPLLRQRPDVWDNQDWLEYIFDTEMVSIKNYRVQSKFVMPGALIVNPGVHDYAAIGERREARRGMVVCVRYDRRKPREVEVELVPTPKDPVEISFVYRMSIQDYDFIKSHFRGEEFNA